MAISKSSNLQTIWQNLIKIGCTKQGAAGLMGNLYSESRCNPTCVEGLLLQRYKEDGHFSFPYGLYEQKNYDLYVSRINNGEITKAEFLSPRSYLGKTYQYGFGLAQWTTKSRKEGLWSYTRGKNKSIADLAGQIEFLIYELKNSFPSVWSVVSTTSSINSASDIVLTKFESPANVNNYIQTRRAYSTEIYNLYKDLTTTKGGTTVTMSIDFNNYYNKISNSGHDERGQYSNGVAGDQGGEWTICNWYQYPWDGGWLCVLRHPNQQVRELIAELAIEAANNDKIGYDQNQRYTYWDQLQRVGYRPSKITTACEADCSAGVIANVKAVGYLLNVSALKNLAATYTGNMRDKFSIAGFQVLTDRKYLSSSSYLVPGDILLNDYNHTATNIGIGSNSGYKPLVPIEYNQSSLTTKQIQTRLKAIGWTDLKVDNDYGPKTIAAVQEFQKLYELTVTGITDSKTEKVLKAVYKIVKTDGFDYKYYADNNKDLKKAFGTDLKLLLHHYYKYGKNEGRKIKAAATSSTSASTKAATTALASTKSTTTTTKTSNELKINTTGTYNTSPKKYGVVTADLLNIRKGPGTSYGNLNSYPTLSKGNEVDVCDMVKATNGSIWYYIRIAGKVYGFASADWIKVSDYK